MNFFLPVVIIASFQSTPSAWRETLADRGAGNTTVISIHSLRMEGDRFVVPHMRQTDISIHSLRMEGDSGLRHLVTNFGISIHSLRMEGDPSSVRKDLHGGNFNPLPPHGGRRQCSPAVAPSPPHFNPLPPHGGRHKTVYIKVDGCYFNPLPPHGGRHSSSDSGENRHHFNPLPPHGGRLIHHRKSVWKDCISIHSLRMEGDFPLVTYAVGLVISIHSLRMEGDFL